MRKRSTLAQESEKSVEMSHMEDEKVKMRIMKILEST